MEPSSDFIIPACLHQLCQRDKAAFFYFLYPSLTIKLKICSIPGVHFQFVFQRFKDVTNKWTKFQQPQMNPRDSNFILFFSTYLKSNLNINAVQIFNFVENIRLSIRTAIGLLLFLWRMTWWWTFIFDVSSSLLYPICFNWLAHSFMSFWIVNYIPILLEF